MSETSNNSRAIWPLSFLYLCFIVSGAVGLIYEIVCASLVSQLIGGASSTHAAVLAFFMAGLAIGNRLGGKWADRLGAPWLLYALIEASIGLLVILALFVADLAGFLYLALAPSPFSDYSWLDSWLRWTLAATVMLPAAIMMGSTLPILVRVTTSSLGDLGRTVGWLYFINSIGAVCGALLAGFLLLPKFGLEQSVVGAGLTNLVLALLIYITGRFVRRERWNQEPTPVKRQDDTGRRYSPEQAKRVLWAIFLSGLASTSLEVAWTRTLSLTLGGTAPAFSLMLATFIGGIAFGGLFASWLTRGDRDAYKPLLWMLSGGALALLVSVPFYDRLPFLFHEFGHPIPKTKEHFGDFVRISAFLAIGVMALPTLALGAALPMASRVITRSLGHAGRSVGRVFSVNTTGNVIGALSAGILILPTVNLEGLFTVILLLLAASLTIASGLPGYRHWWSISVIVIVGTLVSPSWDPLLKMSGLYRFLNQDIGGVEGFRELTLGTRAIFDADDAEMAVGVVERPDGHRILRVNGKTDGGTHGDVPTQILVGQLPAIYHGNPETVLVVGMGTGMTVGSLLTHETIRQIDVVEISPRIVEASRLFDSWTGSPHLDPRVRIHTRDARNFLRILPENTRYDVIISQPSNPWQPGSAALFTVEYFEQVKARLAPGGVFSQWFETYDLSQQTIDLIMNTYSQVFPNSRMFNTVGYDFVILSADQTPSLDVPAATALMRQPRLRAELQRLRTDQTPFTAVNLLSHETLGPNDFKRFWGTSENADSRELHTDRFPRIQYMAASDFFIGLPADFLNRIDGRRKAQKSSDMGLADLYRGRALSTQEAQELINYWRQRPRAVGSKFDEELVGAYKPSSTPSQAAPPNPDRPVCLKALRLDSARLQDGATVLTEPSLTPTSTLLLRCKDYLTDEEGRQHETLAESLRITNSS